MVNTKYILANEKYRIMKKAFPLDVNPLRPELRIEFCTPVVNFEDVKNSEVDENFFLELLNYKE